MFSRSLRDIFYPSIIAHVLDAILHFHFEF
nr:MAG TPA: hypothetical protein [Caudoviricetes sp.]